MKKIFVLGIVVLMLMAVGAVSALNIPVTIQNFGFESPAVLDSSGWDIFTSSQVGWTVCWTAADPSSVTYQGHLFTLPETPFLELQNHAAQSITPPQGSQYAELDSDWNGHTVPNLENDPANVEISQVISTVPGATYHITYQQNCRADDPHLPSILQFDWTGALPGTTTCSVPGWTLHQVDRTATGASTTIAFTDEGTPDSFGVLLDDIHVTQTSQPPAIPEFPSAALPVALIVGMLGTLLFIKSTKEN